MLTRHDNLLGGCYASISSPILLYTNMTNVSVLSNLLDLPYVFFLCLFFFYASSFARFLTFGPFLGLHSRRWNLILFANISPLTIAWTASIT